MRGMHWFLFASLALHTSLAQVSQNHCSDWKLKKSKFNAEGSIDFTRREFLLSTGLEIYELDGAPSQTFFETKGRKYAEASVGVFLPSFILIILMSITCLPIWIMFGCAENCWYKKRKSPENLLGPCVIWGLWLLSVVAVGVMIGVAQLSFKNFVDGLTGSVCDVDGSFGAVSEWLLKLNVNVNALSMEVSGYLHDGGNDVLNTVDSLGKSVDEVNQTLFQVLNNIDVSTTTISAALVSFGYGQVNLPIDQLKQQADEIQKQSGGLQTTLQTAKGSVGQLIGTVQQQVQSFPALINGTLLGAETAVNSARHALFGQGNISLPAIPVLLDNGMDNANVFTLVDFGASTLQKAVLFMYSPILMAAPLLLLGGVLIILVFMACKDDGETCCQCCALYSSKCGCALLWIGVTITLWCSIFFLLFASLYNDGCSILSEPNTVLDYTNQAAVFNKLIPPMNDSAMPISFDIENALNGAKQCLQGSAYSGQPLVKTLGVNLSFVDGLLDQATSALDSGDAIDFSAVDGFLNTARVEVANAIVKCQDYKLGSQLIADVDSSCNQCINFTKTFSNFGVYSGSDSKEQGELCDTACQVQPVEGCTGYNPSIVYPLINIQFAGGKAQANINGQLIDIPMLVMDQVGNSTQINACGICKNKTCGMNSLVANINTGIDDVIGNLTLIDGVIVKTNASIRQSFDQIRARVKTAASDSVKAMTDALDSVDCSVVGDIYNTVVESVCHEGLTGFTQYAWSFVWCALLGLLVIILTILLNLFVGLREREPTDGRGHKQTSRFELTQTVAVGAYSSASFQPPPRAANYLPTPNYVPAPATAPATEQYTKDKF